MKATLNGTVIAESDDTVVVEGNHYFPSGALNPDILAGSELQTVCPWKGTASYYSLEVDGKVAENAAWYYVTPKEGAEQVAGRVAFYPVVDVQA